MTKEPQQVKLAKFGKWVTDRKPSVAELERIPGEGDLYYPYYQGVFLVWVLGERVPRPSRFVVFPKTNTEWYPGYFTEVAPDQKVAWMPLPPNPHETK